VYARVLRQFAENYRQGLAGLDTAMAEGRLVLAQQLLHSLRGACGAVGATDLVAEAQALETALDNALETASPSAGQAVGQADALCARAAAVGHHLGQLVAAIDQRFAQAEQAERSLPGQAAAPEQPSAGRQLDQALDALAGLLEVADFSAGAAHRAIELPLRQRFGDAPSLRLERALRQHDYEAALLALRALRAAPPARPKPAQ